MIEYKRLKTIIKPLLNNSPCSLIERRLIYIINYFLISILIFCVIWMVEDIHILIREYNFKSIRLDISPIYSSLNINAFASPSHSVIVCSKAYFNNILIVVNVHDWFIIICWVSENFVIVWTSQIDCGFSSAISSISALTFFLHSLAVVLVWVALTWQLADRISH